MSEFYELDLRHRAAANEPIRERHDKFMQPRRAMRRRASFDCACRKGAPAPSGGRVVKDYFFLLL